MFEQILKRLVVHLPLQTVQGRARFFLWRRRLWIQLDPQATNRRWSLHRSDEPVGN